MTKPRRSGSDRTRSRDVASPWRRFAAVLPVALRRWFAPRTSLFAAALAFQALLALAPVVLLLLSVAGRILGQERARRGLLDVTVRFAGPGADHVASGLLSLVAPSGWRTAGTLFGVCLLLYFASTFFAQLRAALNTIWDVRPKGVRGALLQRVTSFAETIAALTAGLLVVAVGALRSVIWPLLKSAGLTGTMALAVWTRLGTFLMTFAVLWAAFRYIPDVRPRPRRGAVMAGALPAALTLNLASDVFGFVISRSAVASLYGAAGSLIMFLLWVHYSAWIVLLGAEICRAWDEPARAGS